MHILVHIYMSYNIFTHLDRISYSIAGYQLVCIKLISRYFVELVFSVVFSLFGYADHSEPYKPYAATPH
jgi:hypothetical protein